SSGPGADDEHPPRGLRRFDARRFPANVRVVKARDRKAAHDLRNAHICADTWADPAALPLPYLVDEVRICDMRAGHANEVAVAALKRSLGLMGSENASDAEDWHRMVDCLAEIRCQRQVHSGWVAIGA